MKTFLRLFKSLVLILAAIVWMPCFLIVWITYCAYGKIRFGFGSKLITWTPNPLYVHSRLNRPMVFVMSILGTEDFIGIWR